MKTPKSNASGVLVRLSVWKLRFMRILLCPSLFYVGFAACGKTSTMRFAPAQNYTKRKKTENRKFSVFFGGDKRDRSSASFGCFAALRYFMSVLPPAAKHRLCGSLPHKITQKEKRQKTESSLSFLVEISGIEPLTS